MAKYDKKTILYASLAALGLTLCYSILISASMMVWLIPVAIAALYAWGGPIPAAVLSVGTVFMTVNLGNTLPDLAGIQAVPVPVSALGALLVLVLPAVAVIFVTGKKLPFAQRMAAGIGAQSAALLLGAGIISLSGIDVVNALLGVMRGMVDKILPPDMAVSVLQMFGTVGLLTKETIADVNTLIEQFSRIDPVQLYTMGYTLSAEQMQMLSGALDQAFEHFNYYLHQIMPAMLLHGGLLTGVVMTTFSGWIIKRRDAESDLEHVSVETWQVPRQALGMLLTGLIAGLVMQYMETDSALAVTTVFSMLLTDLLMIQGLAALLRLFAKAGASRGFKIGVLIGVMLLAASVLETVGAMSALLGSEGVISKWMRKRMEEYRKEDDDE